MSVLLPALHSPNNVKCVYVMFIATINSLKITQRSFLSNTTFTKISKNAASSVLIEKELLSNNNNNKKKNDNNNNNNEILNLTFRAPLV